MNSDPLVGVNVAADTTNRLAVSSPATLLNHEGAGHQLKLNLIPMSVEQALNNATAACKSRAEFFFPDWDDQCSGRPSPLHSGISYADALIEVQNTLSDTRTMGGTTALNRRKPSEAKRIGFSLIGMCLKSAHCQPRPK